MLPNEDQDPDLDGAGGSGGSGGSDGAGSGGSGNQGAGSGGGDNGDGGGGDDYFLTVNDRTRFKSQEDAIKSFNEAGERIKSFTPWEQKVKEYGLKDPADLSSLLEELRERRSKDQSTQGRSAAASSGDGAKDPLADLSPADRKAVEWMIAQGPKAGFVTKKEYDELKASLEELRTGNQQSKDEIFNQRVETGKSQLNSLLDEAGLPTDPKFYWIVENALTGWIDADDRRVKAFYAGGDQLKALIKQGFDELAPGLEVLSAASIARAGAGKRSGNSGTNTNRVAAGNSSQRPNNSRERDTRQQQRRPGKPEFNQDDVDEQGWEVFQRVTQGDGE